MPPEPHSAPEGQDGGRALALLGLLTLVGVLAPLFAFLQGTLLLLAASTVAALSAAGLALFALSHGRVEDEDEEEELPAVAAAAVATAPALPTREELRGRLRRTELFVALTSRQLNTVASIGELRWLPAGERLPGRGAKAENIYVVLEGELQLLTAGLGAERPVAAAGAGEAVPLAALLDPAHPVIAILATTPALVYAMPRSRFLQLCERQPTLGLNVYRAAAGILAAGQRAG